MEDFPPRIMRVCDGLSWDTPAGFNLFESRAQGYVEDGKFIISGCRELDTRSKLKYTNRVHNCDRLFSSESRREHDGVMFERK